MRQILAITLMALCLVACGKKPNVLEAENPRSSHIYPLAEAEPKL